MWQFAIFHDTQNKQILTLVKGKLSFLMKELGHIPPNSTRKLQSFPWMTKHRDLLTQHLLKVEQWTLPGQLGIQRILPENRGKLAKFVLVFVKCLPYQLKQQYRVFSIFTKDLIHKVFISNN